MEYPSAKVKNISNLLSKKKSQDIYDKNTGRHLHEGLGAPTLSGTSDWGVNQPQGIQGSYGAAYGALIKAAEGLAVGEEVYLDDNELEILKDHGFKVKQVR